ncbi:MAG: hypothetical protein M1812_003010 [Candelaria pacifica]|nr:MAG: hypothetical protein M1812_003010 [Candelaria pacifica]
MSPPKRSRPSESDAPIDTILNRLQEMEARIMATPATSATRTRLASGTLEASEAPEAARGSGTKFEVGEETPEELYRTLSVARRSVRTHVSNTTRSDTQGTSGTERAASMVMQEAGDGPPGIDQPPQVCSVCNASNANFQDGMPEYVQRFPEIYQSLPFPNEPEEFSPSFLKSVLKGSIMTPSVWYNKDASALTEAYYTMNRKNEPYLPSAPGHHGAKLTAVMQDPGFDMDVLPLFIRSGDPDSKYIYFGDYTQPRISDPVSWAEQSKLVPYHVRDFWGKDLTRPQQAKWRIDAMAKQLYPEMRLKNQRKAEMKVRNLKPADILEAFEKAGLDYPPVLRLSREYLQCVGYNNDFYNTLMGEKRAWRPSPEP